MIIFKKIRYKNFLSTGNVENEIDFTGARTTLVIGANGCGKSTGIDALTYALYGKAFRNINKNQMINSINQKNCLVEVEFSIGKKEYKVTRGMRPHVFTIECDGVVVNQDAALRDYQKVLEQQILRLNYKTFTQVVILGSSSYIPFMQLPLASRREIIEDLLDIRIFSNMNQILKEKIQTTKEAISSIETKISTHREKTEAQKKIIDTMTSSKNDIIESIRSQITFNETEIDQISTAVTKLLEDIQKLQEQTSKKSELETNIELLKSKKTKYYSKKETCSHNISFFSENTSCPSCSQEISDDYKSKIIAELQLHEKDQESKIVELESVLKKLKTKLDLVIEITHKITSLQLEVSTNNNTISILRKQNTKLEDQLKEISADQGDIKAEKDKLKQLAAEALAYITEKNGLLEEREVHDISAALLKDSGIKTAIIREYLPVMNKIINKYLDSMDFYCKFELDESFNEVIKSRHRDEFSYASFSEGEKQKIDLSLMLAWRQIAKMKNSANTNLLILDETFDSSLDSAGTEYFLNIINSFDTGTNTFVISHKGDILLDKFDRTIRFEKKNDFSYIVEK